MVHPETVERLIAAAKSVTKCATDERATEGGYIINPRLIGKLECAIEDAEREKSKR